MSTDGETVPLGTVPPAVLRPGFQSWLALVHSYGSVAKTLDRRLVRDLGMSLAWFEVLVLLHTAPGGRRRLLELSRLLVVSKASVSKLIDRMERAGLVRRESSDEDRRAVFAAVTADGRAALEEALPVQVANVEDCFSGLLDDRDHADLVRILGKVTAHYAGGEDGVPSTPSTVLLGAAARQAEAARAAETGERAAEPAASAGTAGAEPGAEPAPAEPVTEPVTGTAAARSRSPRARSGTRQPV
ncbi:MULTISPECIES: MarR family winged helix-turn-helix transcriptional regulator [Streptomyces]|uniref:MarR family winged helix-turn-helix transcriptional regulator n=1 Tax=Streptomyces ramulosus TaxID=47762 RepID=A0ABW1FC74_9ACTN